MAPHTHLELWVPAVLPPRVTQGTSGGFPTSWTRFSTCEHCQQWCDLKAIPCAPHVSGAITYVRWRLSPIPLCHQGHFL